MRGCAHVEFVLDIPDPKYSVPHLDGYNCGRENLASN